MADLKRNLTQLHNGSRADLRVAEVIPRPPNVLKRRFPVVASATGLQQATNDLPVASKRFKGLKTDPWTKYHKFMKLDQAGLATIAYHDAGHGDRYLLVAIKEEKADEDQFGRLLSFSNANVVNLLDVCYFEQTVHLIYEHVSVSLRQIQSTPRGSLNHCEISSICKEVLDGLEYIHSELQVFHGALNCGNVLVGSSGSVKIANIGQSLLRAQYVTEDTKRRDLKGLGRIMMELMEPETSLRDPDSITLQFPERWVDSQGIKAFLKATQTLSLAELKKHAFLPPRPTSYCLIPHVLMAQISANRTWEIFGGAGSK